MIQRRSAARASTAPLVLVVDDFDDNREMYAEFLNFSGFRVSQARDGHEALEKAFTMGPDLVVMDLSVPGIDGLEATRRLKGDARTKDTPVIAVTGFALANHMKEAKDAGCDLFLTKPCTPDDLLREIRRILGKDQAKTAPAVRRRRS